MQLSYSLDEVCAATGIGKTKIYQLIKTGALKARKLGKRTIILKDDLNDFLAGLETFPVSQKHESTAAYQEGAA